MLSQLIQRQVSLGSTVTFSLKDGGEVQGVLIEIGRDHVTVESGDEIVTILTDTIWTWRVAQVQPPKDDKPVLMSPEKDHFSSPASPPTPADPVVTRKLLEIETRFQAQMQSASITFHTPDFVLPANEIKGKQSANAIAIWNRVRDKYQYAVKINELSAKFGRIQPLIVELKSLADQFPGSLTIRRHLGYLHCISGNRQEAFELHKDLAQRSRNAWDWYNLAVLVISYEQEELACYSLEQFFHSVALTEVPAAWYLYVRLLKRYSNYQALKALAENKSRAYSDKESEILFETSIYFLISAGNQRIATELVKEQQDGNQLFDLIKEAISHLDDQPSNSYQTLAAQMSEQIAEKPSVTIQNEPQGYIYTYKSDRHYGFLRGVDGKTYFFHRSAVSDDDLFNQIQGFVPGKQIPVAFEVAQGPKGPVAIGVALYRTVEEMFNRATEYADDGDYSKAIAQIKKVLDLNPNYPSAREYYEKWREYARVSGVPRGSNPYARAKRVQLIEKDLERAAKLLRDAIKQEDNAESAVKDLAALLVQLGRAEEAIQVLEQNRTRILDQQSVDNLLIGFYQNAGQHDRAISLLEKKLAQTTTEGKKASILWQIASSYLRKEDYVQAEQKFLEVLRLQPDNRTAQRNIAICLFKQAKYDEAQGILNRILSTAPDAQAAELLEAIKQVQAGQLPQIDEILIETTITDISREISGFTQFFLDRCDYSGARADHIQKQTFDHSDIQAIEQLATRSRTIRPRERAGYYLSAAKITSLLEDEDPNQFYKYLCRSFASTGDAIVIEGRPLDSAREFYCESLSVYDGDRSRSSDEQDAVNALVRFLFSTMGSAQVPVKPTIPTIDETLETVLTHHPDRNRVLDAIAYLVFRSRYAANRILNRLYQKSSLQAISLEYLKSKGILISPVKRLDDFVRLWNELIKKILDENRSISNEFRFLTKLELTTAALENSVERLKKLSSRLFFDLDQQRVREVQRILETALELCKQVAFEEQERLCIQIDSHCQDLLREIESSPTKLSVEEMYPVVETIQKKIRARLDDLYVSSIPQITLRLPVETYTPDADRRIEAQVVVSNRVGCSPAESLELVIQEYEDSFTVSLDSSLRGGEQHILRVPVRVSEEAWRSQAFSLPVYAQYRTRSGDIVQTDIQSFSIRLGSEQEFEEIENPYAAYAEGGIVGNPEMFYGRDELIANIAKALQSSKAQSKCVVIYGQKRAGKSSILHHLKAKLQSNGDLILDLGNIGSILDEHSGSPFLYQILWGILKKLEYATEDRVSAGSPPLDMKFPSDDEFYNHHSPLILFKDVFERFRRSASKLPEWRNIRLILLIDEFSYIYGYITKGLIPETFMKNWKALLQENYFNAVLVGQDVMPKFKQHFPNEFGTTQDERVTYLRREDAIRLIDEPIRIGGRYGESRYRERAIDRILDLTAGSPFYIQILCNRLVEYMNRKRASLVTEADVEQVKDELVRGVNALGPDKFDNLINSGDTSEDAISDEDALKVLTAIAVNSKTGPCSRNSIACETHTPVDLILEDLTKRDVVEQTGQYFSIRVGLFKEWLIAHQ